MGRFLPNSVNQCQLVKWLRDLCYRFNRTVCWFEDNLGKLKKGFLMGEATIWTYHSGMWDFPIRSTPVFPILAIYKIASYAIPIDLIGIVQCKWTKPKSSISSLPYSERLALLDLDPLELHRIRFVLVYYYKVFNHLTPFNPSKVFNIYFPSADHWPDQLASGHSDVPGHFNFIHASRLKCQ